MTRNQIIGIGFAIVAAASYLVFGWPVQRAINSYSVAQTNYDRAGSCRAASQAAEAYAQLGWAEKSQEWEEKGALDCAMARLETLR